MTAGVHDLTDVFSGELSTSVHSIARDINDDGVIVGSVGAMGYMNSAARATAWDLENDEMVDLGVFEDMTSPLSNWSSALAIN